MGRWHQNWQDKLWDIDIKQEGNVLQEPAAAMHQLFPLKRLYNVSTKSVSRMSIFPKLSIMRSIFQNVDQTTPNAPLTCGQLDIPKILRNSTLKLSNMQFHLRKNVGAVGPVTFCRDTIFLHHQNVGAVGPMLLFRRDISLYSNPPPPTLSTFAPVDLTAPKVAAGKNWQQNWAKF